MKEPQEEDNVPFLSADDEPTTEVNEGDRHRRHAGILQQPWWLFGIITALILTNITTLLIGRALWKSNLDRTCAFHTSQHECKLSRLLQIRDQPKIRTCLHSIDTFKSTTPSRPEDKVHTHAGQHFIRQGKHLQTTAEPRGRCCMDRFGVPMYVLHGYLVIRGMKIWTNSHTDRPLIVPYEFAEAAGIERNRFHITEKEGGPGYPAFVAVLHQLHCLVSILVARESAFYSNISMFNSACRIFSGRVCISTWNTIAISVRMNSGAVRRSCKHTSVRVHIRLFRR